mgnify:CR=1 FL=1
MLAKEARAQVLTQVPQALRAASAEIQRQNSEIVMLKEKIAQSDLAQELVGILDAKGLSDPSASAKEKVAALLDSGQDLTSMKKALEMRLSDMSFAKVASDESALGGSDPFTAFIVS